MILAGFYIWKDVDIRLSLYVGGNVAQVLSSWHAFSLLSYFFCTAVISYPLFQLLVRRNHCQSFGEQEIHSDSLCEGGANAAIAMQPLCLHEGCGWNIFNGPQVTPTGVRNDRSLIGGTTA